MFSALLVYLLSLQAHISIGVPLQRGEKQPFDVQGHRGGRGEATENTLPGFAWGMIDGATTMEMDNGITKDGVVVVWHDENITGDKCQDTAPVFEGDPDFPYVGKFIANLTLAQLKTLDCGKRLVNFPLQLTYPGTRISTLQEVFDFAACTDPEHRLLWNIESKIDAQFTNDTRGVEDFVQKQHAIFVKSPYRRSITFQSFDWRTLIAMKQLDSTIITSALISTSTAILNDGATWLAGIHLSDFPGTTLAERIVNAAHSIKADLLSPAAAADNSPTQDPAQPNYIPFTTKEMIDKAHALGIPVKPWTVDGLDAVEQLVDWGADGIISDYPANVRRWIAQHGIPVAPQLSQERVLNCLAKHLQTSTPVPIHH
ncbi:hypothetical protein AX16_005516 [Volvariella volvacea WC 439]|nr:hypothetical protein AX16_005516 [Volvariella volvacea WC 439]